jgi:hypothetical protein
MIPDWSVGSTPAKKEKFQGYDEEEAFENLDDLQLQVFD